MSNPQAGGYIQEGLGHSTSPRPGKIYRQLEDDEVIGVNSEV